MYVLHSGGAKGSDYYWGYVLKAIYKDAIIKHYYIDGYKTPYGNTPIEVDKDADKYLKEIANRLNRYFPVKNVYVNMLLRRNMAQVTNSTATYAVGTIKDNIVMGGTGWAVELSKLLEHPIFVFNQDDSEWYKWDNAFIKINDIPKLEKSFAGIGTRNLEFNGKIAIESIIRKNITNTI